MIRERLHVDTAEMVTVRYWFKKSEVQELVKFRYKVSDG
jgi:hypothetical protein